MKEVLRQFGTIFEAGKQEVNFTKATYFGFIEIFGKTYIVNFKMRFDAIF